ncbi:MAG: ribulose-phosphate 3-epimerase [Planctomycetota bacterium]
MKKIKIAASILSADFSRLADEIKKVEQAGVDQIHLDIMDGHFVPNISFGPVIVKAIRPLTRLPLDAHLMIESPDLYLDEFIKAGADIITVHAECYGELRPHSHPALKRDNKFPKEIQSLDTKKITRDLKRIRDQGRQSGVSLNPGTPLCIQEILMEVDEVLIMSVNPGFSGQPFMNSVLPKITALRKIYQGNIKIDGGINNETAPRAVKAGANILVTASYFFSAANHKKLVQDLKNL